jgi:two-component system LytT family response regulator
MRAIIIDDEKVFRDMLASLLKQNLPQVEIISICENAEKGFIAIKSQSPDLVFLDVEMPGLTGTELMDKIEHKNFELIYTTSHDKYALKALKQNAADYLIKPVDSIDLMMAVEKVSKRIEAKQKESDKGSNTTAESKMIALPTGDGLEFYEISNIIRCESETNYTTFYFSDRDKLVITRQLKDVEEMLKGYNFFRTHKSHLVNVKQIKKAYKGEGAYLIMKDGSNVPISRQKKDEFFGLFKD